MFDHEKRDVYRLNLAFVAWAYILAKTLKGAGSFGSRSGSANDERE